MRTAACYALFLVAAWLVLQDARELSIAWYNGVERPLPLSVKVTSGLQILVNLTAMWLALMAA